MPTFLRTLARTIVPFSLMGLLAFVSLLLPARAQSPEPVTGEAVSYSIGLQPGGNLVALPVVPENISAESVVAGIMPALSLLQDDAGRYFVPSQGISEIPTWDWYKAFKVHVSSYASLSITGPSIVPEASPIILPEGASWVPYLRNGALPTEEAFATIASSLVRVEDASGRFFEPNTPESTLDWLLVGQGYRVWLSRPDTLVYPANTLSGNGASEAGTMAQALAMTDLEVGQEIEVLGYYTPGDGGGGRFRVEDSGATPDGGTVFVPHESRERAVTEVLPNNRQPEVPQPPP